MELLEGSARFSVHREQKADQVRYLYLPIGEEPGGGAAVRTEKLERQLIRQRD